MNSEQLQQARDIYRERGWYVARGALNTRTLATVASDVIDELASYGVAKVDSRGTPRFLDPGPGDVPAKAFRCERTSRHERVEELFHQPEFLSIVRGILDTDDLFIHPNKWMRALPPLTSGCHASAGVHQDFVEIQGSHRQVTAWVPVFASTAHSGGLPVYDAPRPAIPLPLRLCDDNASGWRVDDRFLNSVHVPELEPGDVLLFDAFTPHGGATNSGAAWRVSIEGRFQPAGDTLTPSCLEPYGGGTWDEHYNGWTKLAHYWRAAVPPTREFDRSWEQWRAVESLRAGLLKDQEGLRALEIVVEQSSTAILKLAASELIRAMSA